ncbi:MAG: acyltransferase [Cloacibacterium sp.]|jgi:peptidoglycan/LPS O-acetylase OafA/YrhL|nr:acyltransferase [Cloacibacterium sp.]
MLNNLTGLRFYTALWVFVFHLSTEYIKELNVTFLNKGYLGVDVFFILSGFILTYVYYDDLFKEKLSQKKFFNFIVKRFAKIYPLHIITFILVGILLLVGKYIFKQNSIIIQTNTIWQNVFLIHAWGTTEKLSWNFPSWSISAEWFAYIFVFPLSILIYKINRFLWVTLGVSIILFCIYCWVQTPNFDLNNYTYNSLIRIIPEFICGIFLGWLRLKVDLNRITSLIIFVLSMGLLFFVIIHNFYLYEFCVLAFSGIILSLSYQSCLDFLFGKKIVQYLGHISFAFYLFQFISFIIFEEFFKYISLSFIAENLRLVVKFIFAVGINIILASIAYRYLEEPIRKYIIKKMIL